MPGVGPPPNSSATEDKGDVELYPAYYQVWDDLWVKDIPTEVGDTITAADTAFGPLLYVNIVNLRGTISNVRREADLLLFDMGYAGQNRTDTIKVEPRAPISGSGPWEGQRGQVIGHRLKDGTVLAVTVFFFEGDETRDADPTPARRPVPPAEPTADASRADAAQPGGDAWAEARAGLPPSAPVYRPAFMPERFGPPGLEEVETDGQYGPRYAAVVYHAEDELVTFILGMGKGALGNSPPADVTEPITILGARGQLSTTGTTATRSRLNLEVDWEEQGQSYQIKVYSNHLTRDELLRIVACLVPVEQARVYENPYLCFAVEVPPGWRTGDDRTKMGFGN